MLGVVLAIITGATAALLLSDCCKSRNNQKVSNKETSKKEASSSNKASVNKEASEKKEPPASKSASASQKEQPSSSKSEKAALKKDTKSEKSKDADSVPKKEKQEASAGRIWEEEEFVPDYEKQKKSGSRKPPRAATPKPKDSATVPNELKKESEKGVKDLADVKPRRKDSAPSTGRASRKSSQRPIVKPNKDRAGSEQGQPSSSRTPSSKSQSLKGRRQKTNSSKAAKSTKSKKAISEGKSPLGCTASVKANTTDKKGKSYRSKPPNTPRYTGSSKASCRSNKIAHSNKSNKSNESKAALNKSNKSSKSTKSLKSKKSQSKSCGPCKPAKKKKTFVSTSGKSSSSKKRNAQNFEKVVKSDKSSPHTKQEKIECHEKSETAHVTA